MKRTSSLYRPVHLMILLCFLTMTVSADAGWLDTIRQEAEKARNAASSLQNSLEGGRTSSYESEPAQDNVHTESVNSNRQPPVITKYDRKQVIRIQKQLNDLGYEVGTADGIYGAGTRRGIESFQRDHGLREDGIPSSALSARIDTEVRSRRISSSSKGGVLPVSEKSVEAAEHQTDPTATGVEFKPIRPEIVQGKPVVELSGNGITGDAKRLLTMLVINADPDILTPPADWQNEDNNYFGNYNSYGSMLAHLIYDNFDKSVSEKYVTHLPSGIVIWRSRDEFQLRSDKNSALKVLVPQIKEDASKYKFPQQIVMIGTAVPGKYNFDKQAFPFSPGLLWGDPPKYTFPVINSIYDKLYLPTFEAPKEIPLGPEKAQELRSKLVPKGRTSSFPGINSSAKVLYTIELEGVDKGGIRGEVKSIVLYAIDDKNYSNPLYTFNIENFNKTQAVVSKTFKKSWDDSLNWQKNNGGMPDERYFMAVYAVINGQGDKTIESIVKAYTQEAITSENPFEMQHRQNEFVEGFNKDELNGLMTMMKNYKEGDEVNFAGQIYLGEYNLKTGEFPVENIDITTPFANYRGKYPEFTKRYPVYSRVRVRLDEQPKRLSVPSDVAKKLYEYSNVRSGRTLYLPVRIKAHAVKNKSPGFNSTDKYVDVVTSYSVDDLEILSIGSELRSSTNQYLALYNKIKEFNPSWVVWNYSVTKEREREAKDAAESEQKAQEKAMADAADAAVEKNKYAAKYNLLGISIGMDIDTVEDNLAAQFKGKQVNRYTTSPDQVALLMQKYGINLPSGATTQSELIKLSSEANNASTLAYGCRMKEKMYKSMKGQFNQGQAQDKQAEVNWKGKNVSCDEMDIIYVLLINRQSIRQDGLNTAKGIEVGGNDFIALYTDTSNKIIAMYRQIRFPKDSAPPIQELMKNLEAKYGEAVVKPKGRRSGQAIWLQPTTKTTSPAGCISSFNKGQEIWFGEKNLQLAKSGPGLAMTAAGLDSSNRLAKGECSEAIVVTFDSMPDGFFLRQSILADQEDLKSALPPLVKSAEKATTSLVNNEAAPALDVKF